MSTSNAHALSTRRLRRAQGPAAVTRASTDRSGCPAGTEVFSADNHISVAEDIFYERFPDDLKEQAPRIWYEDGA